MRIGLVLTPLDETNLALARQIGVTDVIYYDMATMPMEYAELLHWRAKVEDAGLQLSVVEGGPPMDRIVIPKEGRDEQIEQYKRCIINMGRAGIPVLCYNFMPWSMRVSRTSYSARTRGDALTSAFDISKWDNDARTEEGESSDEQMWDNLEYFLKAVVPVAEASEVKLAMHPDDPPLSPMCGLSRIMRSVDHFQRLLDLVPSPSNGVTLCQGCFSEMGADVPAVIRRFADRVHFAHFRDVTGTAENFVEVFQDDGRTDMLDAVRAYSDIGFEGVVRPDHVPLLAVEEGAATGYTMMGRLYAVGYMRGLMEAVSKEQAMSNASGKE